MPDDDKTTTTPVEGDTTTTTPEPEPPASYTFPFPIPEDLSVASEEDLRALHTQVREHASSFAGLSPADTTEDTLGALRACRDLANDIAGTLADRRDRAAEMSDLLEDVAFADIDDLTGEGDEPVPPTPEPEPAPAPEPTAPEPTTPPATAASRRPIPRVRDVARNTRTPQLPQQARSRFGTMRAASDGPGFAAGTEFPNFDAAVRALTRQVDRYPSHTTARAKTSRKLRPVTVYDAEQPGRSFQLRSYTRNSVVEIRREFPDDLRIKEDGAEGHAYKVAMHAADQKRLPGGSLIKSAEEAVKGGRSLTAAAGWCAPSETIYDLVETETEDGMLDAPELESPRGGWNIPINGGPDFASIYGVLGNGGDTHLSEEDVINDTPKISVEIPCPDFEEIRLGVDYYSLTGGMLQRRGYPEAVGRFSRAAVVALQHKINYGFIADIVAGSTDVGMVPIDTAGDDAVSALMSAIDLAIMDAQYRNRGGFTSTMEVPLPRWVMVQMRAAMARRHGTATVNIPDSEILSWFTTRNAVPRFVVDWQDAFSGLPTGPGGATPLLRMPTTVQFLVYPAGTWVKAVQDVVDLDTIYDSTLLTTNQFIAVFAETGWAALKMQPLSRLYSVHLDPSGVVGCCDPVDSSLLS